MSRNMCVVFRFVKIDSSWIQKIVVLSRTRGFERLLFLSMKISETIELTSWWLNDWKKNDSWGGKDDSWGDWKKNDSWDNKDDGWKRALRVQLRRLISSTFIFLMVEQSKSFWGRPVVFSLLLNPRTRTRCRKYFFGREDMQFAWTPWMHSSPNSIFACSFLSGKSLSESPLRVPGKTLKWFKLEVGRSKRWQLLEEGRRWLGWQGQELKTWCTTEPNKLILF